MAPVAAQQIVSPPAYSDNRSDAGELVRSFYNAVNRREFARAWSYFSTPPKDFEAFVKGYEDTVYVDVYTGRINSEGAAGSTYSQVAVAIRATDSRGDLKVFAGCYTVKAVNAQIQEPPFRALLIEKASLKPVEDVVLYAAAPEWCGDGEAPKETKEEELARAISTFAQQNSSSCDNLKNTRGPDSSAPDVYEMKSSMDSEAPRLFRLYGFSCSDYAYNFSTVYYLANDEGEITKVSFSEPHMDITYEDTEGTKLKAMTFNGLTSSDSLINSSFDQATLTLSSFSKWRGLGDAATTGTWVFRGGEFVLTGYDVDPTTDGEINPVHVMVDGKFKN